MRESGVGIVLRSLSGLAPAVHEMLRALPEFRERVGWIDNRAVFEVPEILAGLLEAAATPDLATTLLRARAAA